LYPFNDPGQLPIKPLREPNGEWLRLPVTLSASRSGSAHGRRKSAGTMLYLLDSNDPANPPAYQGITSELYGGRAGSAESGRKRCWASALAAAARARPANGSLHLNEGHAAFAVLERARSYISSTTTSLLTCSLAITRAGNLFTTHTPVDAGFDRFPPALMERYFKRYAEDRLNISLQDLLALGRRNPNDNSEPFNMAYLALRGCGAVNGVSRLHGEVSRRIFQPLFPRWPEREVPVGHVTNMAYTRQRGIRRTPTPCGRRLWEASLAGRLGYGWRRMFGGSMIPGFGSFARRQENVSSSTLENVLARQRASQGANEQQIAEAQRVFDPNTLTLGFARRFAAYKRPNLLLQDPDRLLRI